MKQCWIQYIEKKSKNPPVCLDWRKQLCRTRGTEDQASVYQPGNSVWIVKESFHRRTSTWGRGRAAANSTCRICPNIINFLPTPADSLFYCESRRQCPCIYCRKAALAPFFCTKTYFSVEQEAQRSWKVLLLLIIYTETAGSGCLQSFNPSW